MKKFCFVVLVLSTILLMITPLFSQTPNENTSAEGKTGFTHIAVVGQSRDGTLAGIPGYMEMVNPAGGRFYIYVDSNGYLRIASATAISTTDVKGEPNLTVDWRDLGDKVGSQ